MFRKSRIALSIGLALTAPAALVASSFFSSFTPLDATAPALPANDPLEATPFVLSSPNFTQKSIADRATQIANCYLNSGAWDMYTVNVTGPNAGRYLFTPFETNVRDHQSARGAKRPSTPRPV